MAPLGLKLLKIYDVAKDTSFLVDLCDDELNVENLISIIRERGKKLGYDFQRLNPFSEGTLDKKDVQILVFGNIKLQSGRLPDECLRDTQDPIHIVPAEVEAQTFFTVTVKVCVLVLPSDGSCLGGKQFEQSKYMASDILRLLKSSS
jgi:hypothetical protein